MSSPKFHMPDGRYFLSHSIGLRPHAYDEGFAQGFAAPWATASAEIWDHWLATLEGFRENLSPLIGADATDICPQTNVSGALTKILFSLPPRGKRRRILLSEDDFPTIGFVAEQVTKAGYELIFLPGGPALGDPDTWLSAMDETVFAVIATHAYSNTGVVAPVAEIAAAARSREIYSILDVAQSVGAIAINLNDWRPDFAIGTSVKYLCGGPGAAFLWADPETAKNCTPVDVGWFSHEAPFEFDIHAFRYAGRAARFWGGTPSVAPYAGAAGSFKVLAETGIEVIHKHNQAMIGLIHDALPADVILSPTGNAAHGSHVLISPRDIGAASKALAAANILHDVRLDAVRASVHLYTTEEDIAALIGAITPQL